MANPVIALLLAALVCLPTESAAAQTGQLEEDAGKVIDDLALQGITDREGLFDALNAARDSDRSEEYGLLRTLGISMSDDEFDSAWQNQPNRSSHFDRYELEFWTGDVMRSWGKVRPREAFVWLYATRDEFGYSLGEFQTFQRVTGDWARTNGAAAEEAEREALALTRARLREEAIAGVMSGNILRGDGRRIEALMAELTDDTLRAQVESLLDKYF